MAHLWFFGISRHAELLICLNESQRFMSELFHPVLFIHPLHVQKKKERKKKPRHGTEAQEINRSTLGCGVLNSSTSVVNDFSN